MKVVFDSNVWRPIVSPDKFPLENSLEDFKKIRTAIENTVIEAYMSETAFTIESIKKVERKATLGNKNSKVETKEQIEGDIVQLSFKIGPKGTMNFDNNPILKNHFDDAIALGIKIVRLPRIGGLINEEVEKVRFQLDENILKDFHDKGFEVGGKIEGNEAGIFHIQQIGKKYDTNWIKGIKKAPESEKNSIAKAAAEWADGDSVAVCIALDCDYFCTRDLAKSAGEKSVLSSNNLEWLKNDYNFKIIAPEDLATLI